jgi:16S rRNA (adenine(1408)-N(1))-methyltransferase
MGAGDGRFVLSAARRDPTTLSIGIDANVAGMADASRRAPANALFVRAAVEELPDELDGAADAVTVLMPWGSLFEAMLAPRMEALQAIRRLCRSDAELRVVSSIDVARDAAMTGRLGCEPFSESHLAALRRAYAEAGFAPVGYRPLGSAEMRELGTTWAKRVALAPGRMAMELRWRAEA